MILTISHFKMEVSVAIQHLHYSTYSEFNHTQVALLIYKVISGTSQIECLVPIAACTITYSKQI